MLKGQRKEDYDKLVSAIGEKVTVCICDMQNGGMDKASYVTGTLEKLVAYPASDGYAIEIIMRGEPVGHIARQKDTLIIQLFRVRV